jgi:beta-glucanase (GH16 family)
MISNFLSAKNKIKASTRFACLLSLLLLSSQQTVNAGWQVQWMDDFTGSGLNWQNWTAQIQANYNNEVQCYTEDDSSANRNYEVSNGTLKIIARRQTTACVGLGGQQKSWTSGRINSKDKAEFLYGRVEARIRFLNLEKGTWPAFWMLENRIAEEPKKNDNDFINWPNPGAGEIDVWEWFSNRPDSYITNFFNTSSCGAETLYNYPGGPADVTQWHNYAIERSATTIEFFVDDIKVTSHDVTNCAQYKEPMFVLLNVAIGGSLGGSVDPTLTQATMEVDYVAYCSATDSNDSAYCNESTTGDLDDDADGVLNASDLCPLTSLGASVDVNGCAADQEINVAPSVSLKLEQNNQEVIEVDAAKGLVTITAEVSDPNSHDSFVLNWLASALGNAQVNDLVLSFDPLDLAVGTYTISVQVFDDGYPSLANTGTLTFELIANQAPSAYISLLSGAAFVGTTVQLSAAGSSDPEQDSLTYLWTQTEGPDLNLIDASNAVVSFVVPELTENMQVTFSLAVSDGQLTDYAIVKLMLKKLPDTETPAEASAGSIGTSLLSILFFYFIFNTLLFKKTQAHYNKVQRNQDSK